MMLAVLKLARQGNFSMAPKWIEMGTTPTGSRPSIQMPLWWDPCFLCKSPLPTARLFDGPRHFPSSLSLPLPPSHPQSGPIVTIHFRHHGSCVAGRSTWPVPDYVNCGRPAAKRMLILILILPDLLVRMPVSDFFFAAQIHTQSWKTLTLGWFVARVLMSPSPRCLLY